MLVIKLKAILKEDRLLFLKQKKDVPMLRIPGKRALNCGDIAFVGRRILYVREAAG